MTRDLEDVLTAIDGALADEDLPDAMRWSPDPEHTPHPEPWHTEDPGGSYIEDTLPHLLDRMRADRARFLASEERGRLRAEQAIERAGLRYQPVTPERIAAAFGVPLADRLEVPDPRLMAVLGPSLLRVRTVNEDNGSLTLILEPDTERLQATFRAISEAMRPAVEALGQTLARVGEIASAAMQDLRPILERQGLLPDDGPDRVEQPFERALWVKAQRGTGPDRQVQHRPRPRRHVL